MNQQLPGAARFVGEDRFDLVFRDIGIEEIKFAALWSGIGIRKIGAAGTQGFHFGSCQNNTGFHCAENAEVMTRPAVIGGNSTAISVGRAIITFPFIKVRSNSGP